MPTLPNARHEAFAQHLAKGMSQAEAYEAAGYRCNSAGAAKTNASRLLTDANVLARVRELQEASAEEAVVTAAQLSEQLEDIRLKALASGQLSAAVNATMGRAKLHGLIIDKAEVKDVTPMDADTRRSEINRLLAKAGPHLRVVGG